VIVRRADDPPYRGCRRAAVSRLYGGIHFRSDDAARRGVELAAAPPLDRNWPESEHSRNQLREGFVGAKRLLLVGLLVLTATACGSSKSSSSTQALQTAADKLAIQEIEVNWHKASSTKNIDLMMSLWAPDATFNIGTETLTGKAQIRDFFVHKAAPFQPENTWVSDTPEYKLRTTLNGDKGTLYFECHYVDAKTSKVVSVVGADQNVAKINGKWLITNSAAATPTLSP
jgi:hypothetical protein